MILPDTSAWISYLRQDQTPVSGRLERAIDAGESIAVTEPVVMEVVAGARSTTHSERLRDALLAFVFVPLASLDDYEAAAAIYRVCRDAGETPRGTMDCLIAAVALRVGASVLHTDRDFERIARHTDLALEPST